MELAGVARTLFLHPKCGPTRSKEYLGLHFRKINLAYTYPGFEVAGTSLNQPSQNCE